MPRIQTPASRVAPADQYFSPSTPPPARPSDDPEKQNSSTNEPATDDDDDELEAPIKPEKRMAPQPPSSVSIGKKPMAYQQNATPAPGQPARSARAAGKAAAYPPANPSAAANSPNANNNTASPNASAVNDKGGGSPAADKGKGVGGGGGTNKIWSTSSSEERERIRDFWLALGEDERRDLVRVEKDTVLRKMKEQQKHSCSCAVCGRKRNAIEEELQVLYDAYYEDLEQYALYQQQYLASLSAHPTPNSTPALPNAKGKLPPPPGPGPFP
ncbi:salt tolerance down-regulator-domain-containing protein [Mycena maculata]|uniref:Stress response protein NST1 n=1 Tax=Mycena maculata TaxID=230809 RepID=A0AAD7NPF6_9AGAR|nr:salt tolerance down-regulator-domain-containing protein [Mycena maculata]